ncbi:hypothetical protein LCGC14_1035020 [marine sediment metagenome]|uniref:Uncharacterized protein n=1 Tax=marine sediment metagenome TaxID=412755 RepID=A0A0F9MTG5_9ZZZZ
MSYENAPATRMLATQCAACGRPLVDAVSVEAGMGPDCRKRYSKAPDVSAEARATANKLVHRIALDQRGPAVVGLALELEGLGFKALADRIVKRLKVIKVLPAPGNRLAVTTPYDPDAVEGMRAVPGRRWDHEAKVNSFPASSRRQLWGWLQRFYPGQTGLGADGAFTIPGAAYS